MGEKRPRLPRSFAETVGVQIQEEFAGSVVFTLRQHAGLGCVMLVHAVSAEDRLKANLCSMRREKDYEPRHQYTIVFWILGALQLSCLDFYQLDKITWRGPNFKHKHTLYNDI